MFKYIHLSKTSVAVSEEVEFEDLDPIEQLEDESLFQHVEIENDKSTNMPKLEGLKILGKIDLGTVNNRKSKS